MPILKVGDKAPDFALPDQDGKMIDLADLLGQYVVIYFYPKALTPGCTVQACSLRDNETELKRRGIRVVGVSADPSKLLYKFIEKESLNFTLLGDESHKMIEEYGAWQQKSMYGKSYMGLARMSYVLDKEGTVVHVLPKVNPKTHTQEILEWVDGHR